MEVPEAKFLVIVNSEDEKMKKLIAMLVLLLMGLAPLAVAETDVNASDTTISDDADDTTISDDADDTSDNAIAKHFLRAKSREEVKERRRKAKDKHRAIRERYKQARKVSGEIRKIRKETRQQLKKNRDEFKTVRDDLKKCKGIRSEECDVKRSEAKLVALDVLSSAASEVLGMLEEIKARISESTDSDEAKKKIIEEIDEQIQDIEEAAQKVEQLDESSSREEIKNAAKDIRKALKRAKHKLKRGAHALVARKIGGVLKKSEKLKERLEKVLDKLEDKGIDTSSVDVEGFDAILESAKTAHSEAVDLFNQAKNAEEAERAELMKQATDKIRESHKLLKDAHQKLREVVKQIKSLRGGDKAIDSDDEADEEEADDNENDESADE